MTGYARQIRPAARSAADRDLLSEELRLLVDKNGPLYLSAVAALYQAMFPHKIFNLMAQQLRSSLQRGGLPGLRYDEDSEKMELDKSPSSAGRESSASAAATAAAAGGQALPPPTAAPSTTSNTASPAPRTATIVGAATHTTAVSVRDSAKQSGLGEGAGISARVGDQRGEQSLGGAFRAPSTFTVGSAHPSGMGDTRFSVGGEDFPLPSRSPSDANLPYLLVDSRTSFRQTLATVSRDGALGNTLQHVCMGCMVVVQLNGHEMGSETGYISLIKVCSCSWVRTPFGVGLRHQLNRLNAAPPHPPPTIFL